MHHHTIWRQLLCPCSDVIRSNTKPWLLNLYTSSLPKHLPFICQWMICTYLTNVKSTTPILVGQRMTKSKLLHLLNRTDDIGKQPRTCPHQRKPEGKRFAWFVAMLPLLPRRRDHVRPWHITPTNRFISQWCDKGANRAGHH